MRRPKSSAGTSSWFLDALIASDIERLTPHDPRHTAASLAVSSGANAKAVERMLGHSLPR
ncbi:tyrosine-type recombinase/integrase [Leifsonia sp. T36S-04]